MTDAIRIDGLAKHYGSVRALRGIDLAVAEGEIFGFLGPNGSGKSTAIRILLDLIRPTAGRAAIFGRDCQADALAARAQCGYLPSDPVFPSGTTGNEVFDYHAALRANAGGHPADRGFRAELIERLQLSAQRPVSELSRGNRQEVGLIQALAARPPLVILDEPTTGLDPLMQEEVEAILRELAAAGHTVFFSSHILGEVESICDRVAIIRDGQIATVLDLAEHRRNAPLEVAVTFAAPPPADAFAALPAGVQVQHLDAAEARFEVRDAVDALIARLTRCRVAQLHAAPASLSDLFIRYYAEEGAAPAPPARAGGGGPTGGRAAAEEA